MAHRPRGRDTGPRASGSPRVTTSSRPRRRRRPMPPGRAPAAPLFRTPRARIPSRAPRPATALRSTTSEARVAGGLVGADDTAPTARRAPDGSGCALSAAPEFQTGPERVVVEGAESRSGTSDVGGMHEQHHHDRAQRVAQRYELTVEGDLAGYAEVPAGSRTRRVHAHDRAPRVQSRASAPVSRKDLRPRRRRRARRADRPKCAFIAAYPTGTRRLEASVDWPA